MRGSAPTAIPSAEALERFAAEHWARLARVAFLISRDRSAAEDIAQDAMLKALAGLPSFDRARPVEPWLDRIAANAARDWLRKKARRPETLVDQLPDSREDVHSAEADAALIARTLPDRLGAALDQLEPEFRAVVVMRHLLDMTAAEIGEVLGVAEATARTRDRRALLRLREVLRDKEELDA